MSSSNWKKTEKMINAGIQPEDHITYQYRADRKRPIWTAVIRYAKLKRYNEEGWIKKISSSQYASMDAFYAASIAIRDSMQDTLVSAEAAIADGKNPIVPSLPKSGIVSKGHTLDEIMGCKVEQNVDPVSGTPYTTRVKDKNGEYVTDSFGNYVTKPVMHMAVIQGNDFDSVFKGMVKYSTLIAYRYSYYNYIHPEYGNRTVESIQVGEIEHCLREAGTKLGMGQLRHLKALWKKIFLVAGRKGYRLDDPTNLVVTNNYHIVDHDAARKRRKGSEKERREVSDEKFKQVLEIVLADQEEIKHNHPSSPSVIYAHQTMAHALVLMRNTGLRPAECFAVRKQDIIINKDADGKMISAQLKVEHNAARGENSVMYIHETKTPLSESIIPLNADALEVLQDMIKRGKERKADSQTREIWNEHHTIKFKNSDFVFTDYRMNLCNPSRMSEKLGRWLKPYGIKYNMYTNRHQFSTDMSDQSIATAQTLMRHVSSSTTLTYVEGEEGKMQKAVDSISGNYSSIIKQSEKEYDKARKLRAKKQRE